MTQFFNKKRGKIGFTLIELLVVIAIIGILAGIVLVALGGARDRARAARVQSDLSQIRSLAEMINAVEGNYDNVCTGGSAGSGYQDEWGALTGDITNQGGTVNCTATSTSYCISSPLPGGGVWCIDSDGRSQNSGTCDTQPDGCED